jgi:hypothetical protein
MMIRASILAGVVVVGACGGSKKPAREPVANVAPAPAPAPSPAMSELDQLFAGWERFERDMCACAPKDANCAKAVSDALAKWTKETQANRDKAGESMHMTEEQMSHATRIGAHMADCLDAAKGLYP